MEKVNLLIVWLSKLVSFICRTFGFGAGGTWPGHLALVLRPNILRDIESRLSRGSILITGTNGKTTTAKMLTSILKGDSYSVVYNPTGANLLNGIASALIVDTDFWGRPCSEIGVFEVDEAYLPQALKMYDPEVVVVLNLFRDQLDRYGEVDLTAEKIHQALKRLPEASVVILNPKNSYVAPLGKNLRATVRYFGDGVSDVVCDSFSSHFEAEGTRFEIPLGGGYIVENAAAAITVAKSLGVGLEIMRRALRDFRPAFGRQEEFKVGGKKVKILLSKNPVSFNKNVEMLKTLKNIEALLLVLNDNIPDGRDVSWVWDTDPAGLLMRSKLVIVSGLRAEDAMLRLKYSQREFSIFNFLDSKNRRLRIFSKELKSAILTGLKKTPKGGTFYIMPTYSAMLEVRKILTGRKIL